MKKENQQKFNLEQFLDQRENETFLGMMRQNQIFPSVSRPGTYTF